MKTKINKKERIIYTNMNDDIEDWKESFEEYCDMNDLDQNEESIYDYISRELNYWFDDEWANLSSECGSILAIADLELWDGHHTGYKIIHATKLHDIFRCGSSSDYYYVKYYCDQYNVKAELIHHDGVNMIELREIKPNKNIKPLLDKLYNQEEVTREMIRQYTTSLRPKVAKIYGW